MNFLLTEEQQLFADSARRILQARSPVSALRRLRDSRDAAGFDRELWSELASMGWAGVLVPEEYGGVAFGFAGAGLIAEEMGRTLASLPWLSTAVLAVRALREGGSPEQRKALLPGIASGEILVALAADERPRHAPHDVRCEAIQRGNVFRLSGRKTFVLDGHIANRLLVSAHTGDASRLTLLLVDPQAQGVSIERTVMVDSRNAAEVRFEAVELSRSAVVGRAEEGAALLDSVLDAGRAVLAAEMVGIADECLARTLEYLRQREQFGRKVGEFQALQHRAAHLYCEIELARSAAAAALRALDAGSREAPLLVSAAKAKSAEVVRLATNEALQMHGGIGMTDEFDIGFFIKRARAGAETFGDYAFHAERVARLYGF